MFSGKSLVNNFLRKFANIVTFSASKSGRRFPFLDRSELDPGAEVEFFHRWDSLPIHDAHLRLLDRVVLGEW